MSFCNVNCIVYNVCQIKLTLFKIFAKFSNVVIFEQLFKILQCKLHFLIMFLIIFIYFIVKQN